MSAEDIRRQGQLSHFYSDVTLSTPPPEYLDVDEKSRLFERTMSLVGKGYIAALGAGTVLGAYNGLRYGETGSFKIRLNAVLNAIGRRAIRMANSTAVILLMYQTIDLLIGLQQQIPEEEDEYGNLVVNPLNEEIKERPQHALIAGTLAGALFRSPGGLKKSLIGAGIGFTASFAHCLYTRRLWVGGYFDLLRERIRTWRLTWKMKNEEE